MGKDRKKEKIMFWVFMAPALLAFLMVQVVPFFLGLYYSFTNWTASAQSSIDIVGLKNYIDAFKDTTFLYSTIINHDLYSFKHCSGKYHCFLFSDVGDKQHQREKIYIAPVFFLPNVIGGIILGYIWQFVFNSFVPKVGIALGIAWFDKNMILANANTALIALVIVSTWQYAGYIMMIYVAALQNVPRDLIEAAQIRRRYALATFQSNHRSDVDASLYGHVILDLSQFVQTI